jgi:hypothetical protein
MAFLREDHQETIGLESLLYQLVPEAYDRRVRPFIDFYRTDDPGELEPGQRGSDTAGFWMMLFTEHELIPPEAVTALSTYHIDDMTLSASRIVSALSANDNEALARAIDDAEERQLTVHAAHMRIVLAKRTGDLSRLERARSVLTRLEDRLFLRKADAVAEELQKRRPSSCDS